MLKIDDLEAFCEAYKEEEKAIKEVLLLVDDDDYTKFVEEVKHTKKEAMLITVLPSVNLNFKDENNFKFTNFLHFFIIQKGDKRSGYQEYVNHFKFCQPLVLSLFEFIYKKHEEFNECIFKDFDLSKLSIDPVTDKTRTYGYSISVPLNTKYN